MPYGDRGFFQGCTATMVSRAASPAERHGVAEKLRNYLDELVTAKEKAPGDDLSGKFLASAQRSQQLKWEMAVGVAEGIVQAVASANCHNEHFGDAFGITDARGREEARAARDR
ncbi:hypothetical protein ABZV31_06480 [Streptomyces sp. NPDC005202]|uniref:hypothetical protein n=1 Tax=Streptomyces sp. NPDC005202 TaxID=3157021 RepID=UPI0033A62506